MEFLELLDDTIRDQDKQIPSDHDLVLELEARDSDVGGYHWCYYFVNHEKRTLFWLHDCDISNDLSEVKGATVPAHVSTYTYFERTSWMLVD